MPDSSPAKRKLIWIVTSVILITLLIISGVINSYKNDAENARVQRDIASKAEVAAQVQADAAKKQAEDKAGQAADAQSQLADTQAQLIVKNQPEMHFRADFPAPDDGTDMRSYITIYNDQSEDATVDFVVTRAGVTTNGVENDVLIPKVGSITLTIPDWTFIPGDKLTLSENGHQGCFFIIPAP